MPQNLCNIITNTQNETRHIWDAYINYYFIFTDVKLEHTKTESGSDNEMKNYKKDHDWIFSSDIFSILIQLNYTQWKQLLLYLYTMSK